MKTMLKFFIWLLLVSFVSIIVCTIFIETSVGFHMKSLIRDKRKSDYSDINYGSVNIEGNENQSIRPEMDAVKRESTFVPSSHRNCKGSEHQPSLDFEQLRRQAVSDVHFALERLTSEMTRINHDNVCGAILPDLEDHLRITANDLDRLSEAEWLREWREREAAELSALVQHRLRVLQHPAHCDSAKKIYCDFTQRGRGIGSQLHHLSYCFLAAYGTQRTLILDTSNFYGNPRGLETVLLPLSDTCTTADMSNLVTWPGNEDSLIILFPGKDRPQPRPKYFPRSIPKDLSDRLLRLHGDPFAWWMGQFFKYALRRNKDFEEYVQNLEREILFKAPIVGLHIRRTDKLTKEAQLLGLEEYMKGVNHYYEGLELRSPGAERRIFLATDDYSVVEEIKEKYPKYELAYSMASIQSAKPKARKSGPNLKFFLADLYFLSRSNYLVCAMTSNMCRLAYEIMQTLHPDASMLAWSVDKEYDFHYQSAHYAKARYAHKRRRSIFTGREELELKKGDLIYKGTKYFKKHHNAKDGFLYGVNTRTNTGGLYPVYKTVDILDVADDLPSFDDIDQMNYNVSLHGE